MDRRSKLLNARLAGAIVGLGHTDTLVVADAGLPIPPGVELLDLALVPGVPGFTQTLQAILEHLQVEAAVVAAEFAAASPALCEVAMGLLDGIDVRRVTHEEFKSLTRGAKLIVRTGECTPYANVILRAGVTF